MIQKKKGIGMAFSQIMILLVGTVAFSYLIGQIGFVNAGGLPSGSPCTSGPECDSGICPGGDSGIGLCAPSAPLLNINSPTVTTGNYPSTTPDPANSPYGSGPGASPTANGAATGGASTAAGTAVNWEQVGTITVQVIKDLAINAGIAFGVYWLAGQLKSAIGLKPGDTWNYAYTAGQFVLTGAVFGALEMSSLATTFPGIASTLGTFWGGAIGGGIIGAGIAVAIFLLFYKTTKINAAIISCVPWQAPTGGNDCSKCGQNGLPCTAYQCASLGQACQLKNAGGSGKPLCVWVNQGDITPPVMTFLNVLPNGYTYSPLNAQSPGDTGILIQSSQPNGLISPFTTLPLGITTDKASECKYDIVRGDNFTTMGYMMSGGIDGTEGLWGYNHTLNLPIFGPSSSGGTSAQQSGQFDVYFRCQNANGYADISAFDTHFVIDTTPDQTAPLIQGESIQNGGPVPFGTTSTTIGVYVNEPVSGCQWSHNNVPYGSMENNMSCSNAINTQGIFTGTFTCNAALTGIKNNVENDFYFACNDTSGNVDTQTYKYYLMGTQPLVISSVSPTNGTLIKDSTSSVKVTLNVQTSAGQSQGQSTCYYSATGNPSDYLQFVNTNSYQSAQELWLTSGTYNYYFKCVDLGGNAVYSSVNFQVQTDTQSPNVVRATHDGANLGIQTDENATCVYDIVDCTYPFEDGTAMTTSSDGITQSTSWVAGRTYYIKCQDSFGNQPAPNSCSIVLSPSQS